MRPQPPGSTLFPYTTLFRSESGRALLAHGEPRVPDREHAARDPDGPRAVVGSRVARHAPRRRGREDRKSTRLNSSHPSNSYAVFCLKKKNKQQQWEQQDEDE